MQTWPIKSLKSLPEQAEQQWRLQRENHMCGEELLFSATSEYKVNKIQENVDSESCQLKYNNIVALFLEQFPFGDIPGQKKTSRFPVYK